MKLHRQTFTPDQLLNLGSAPPDDPPLGIGDYAALNSGGPVSLVVDADDNRVVLSWQDGDTAHEYAFLRVCVRRVTPEPPTC